MEFVVNLVEYYTFIVEGISVNESLASEAMDHSEVVTKFWN
jgi:hypothetical protein